MSLGTENPSEGNPAFEEAFTRIVPEAVDSAPYKMVSLNSTPSTFAEKLAVKVAGLVVGAGSGSASSFLQEEKVTDNAIKAIACHDLNGVFMIFV